RLQGHRPDPDPRAGQRLPAGQPGRADRAVAGHADGHVARHALAGAVAAAGCGGLSRGALPQGGPPRAPPRPSSPPFPPAGPRLAWSAPAAPRGEGSDELLDRLDADELADLWQGRP